MKNSGEHSFQHYIISKFIYFNFKQKKIYDVNLGKSIRHEKRKMKNNFYDLRPLISWICTKFTKSGSL